MEELVLIRGLPGSGKSTMACAMQGYVHVEADQFFLKDGIYQFDGSQLKDAHEWCIHKTRRALKNGQKVVVANTFTRVCELQPYRELAAYFGVGLTIIEAQGTFQNVHGVPEHTIQRMQERWETV